jgi:hypothetical protein
LAAVFDFTVTSCKEYRIRLVHSCNHGNLMMNGILQQEWHNIKLVDVVDTSLDLFGNI